MTTCPSLTGLWPWFILNPFHITHRTTHTDPKLVRMMDDNDFVIWGGDLRDRISWDGDLAIMFPILIFF